MNRLKALWSSGCVGKIVIVGGLLVVLVICAGILSALGGGQGTETVQEPQATTSAAEVAGGAATVAPTKEPEATATARPTRTPRPTATPQATATPNVGQVGERREAGGLALTVLQVGQAAQIQELLEPQAGNVFLTAEVLIENVNRDETPYNPLYFALKDADGFQYQVSVIGPDPALQAGKLPKGDKARGWIAFEVAKGAKELVLSYEPLVILGGYEPIRIAVGDVE